MADMGKYSHMFDSCEKLEEVRVEGANFHIRFRHSILLDAAARNQIFEDLAEVGPPNSGTMTIVMPPNDEGEDTTIATAKGWAVSYP